MRWTGSARADLVRIYEFLEPVDRRAAGVAIRHLVAGAKRISAHPRLGNRLRGFGKREVRRLVISDYELRYELSGRDVIVLRIFHTREDR